MNHDEVVFITQDLNNTTLSSNELDKENALKDSQMIECLMRFSSNNTAYAGVVKILLENLLYDFCEKNTEILCGIRDDIKKFTDFLEFLQCTNKQDSQNFSLYGQVKEITAFPLHNITETEDKSHVSLEKTQTFSHDFVLYMYADSKKVLDFSEYLSHALPFSSNFHFKEILPLELHRDKQKESASTQDILDIQRGNDISQYFKTPQKHAIFLPNIQQLNTMREGKQGNYAKIGEYIKLIETDLFSLDIVNISSHIESIYNVIDFLAKEILESKKIILQRNDCVFSLCKSYKSLQTDIDKDKRGQFLDTDFCLENTQQNCNTSDSKNQVNMNNKTIEEKNLQINFKSCEHLQAIQNPCVIFFDLYNAQSYLRLSESQKIALASFESPFIKIFCKNAFYKQFKSYSPFVKLPNDCILLLLFARLRELDEGIDFLFYEELAYNIKRDFHLSSQNVALRYFDDYPLKNFKHNSFVVGENVALAYHQTCKDFIEILRRNATDNPRFVIYLSHQHNSKFFIENPHSNIRYQQILEIKIMRNLGYYLQILHDYKNGDKLLLNFAHANKDLLHTWNLNPEELQKIGLYDLVASHTTQYHQTTLNNENISMNLLDIFELIEQFLGLKKCVLDFANQCVRDRGPRIDYKLIKDSENNIVIDYARLLRSVASFHLAGVEHELLCYGVIDSMAEFIGTLAGDIMLNYGIKEVFVCGDLLLEQCFLDRILHSIPKNMIFNLPVFGTVDTMQT
ncbi:hypothetical protein CQA53_04130 [Helicobacter didelphidarum]|uniref:Protein hydE n=1 Tax=Helicobacter didelphidarum TaxID=2040648 RepID=A0A3D8IMN2_9HELI|nr:hypothetical protein [Helicobacter didelphidarum]RDU66205.1 hypothetical protein CQA53_04130 [Helicobacter didelphidarum]